MKHNRAFTLIEVMVVLSILALIAILAYNFFGSTMKEATLTQAATKTYNDMRILSDAWDESYRKNGVELDYSADDDFSAAVTDGILKALPKPPAAAAGVGGLQPNYELWDAWDNFAGTATQDRVIEMYNVTDDFCKRYNELYTGLGSVVWDYNTLGTYPPNEATFCFKPSASLDQNETVMILEVL